MGQYSGAKSRKCTWHERQVVSHCFICVQLFIIHGLLKHLTQAGYVPFSVAESFSLCLQVRESVFRRGLFIDCDTNLK